MGDSGVRIVAPWLLAALVWASPSAIGTQGGGADQQQPARSPDIFFVPTTEAIADQMLQLAGVKADDIVYDLGSGDGRIVMLAAQKYGARGVGIEIDPRLVERSWEIAREAQVAGRVSFVVGDLFDADISEATVVTLYLSYSINRRLKPKLLRELRPGTRVVSHQFAMGTWTPDKRVPAEDHTDLFLWTIPPR
jgi:SAM-dependent methyltransferase